MIRNEEKRLRETFQRLFLLALAAPAAAQACSSSTPSQLQSSDGGVDAAMDSTAMMTVPEAEPPETGTPLDASVDAHNCQASQPYFSDASYAMLPEAGPDAALAQCYYFVDLPCGTAYEAGTGAAACYLYLADCANLCTLDAGFVDCLFWEGKGCLDGSTTATEGMPATIACGLCNGVGRRPAGLLATRGKGERRAAHPLGEYFAKVAHLEAASVFAFERLRDELHAHGAPSELVRAAERMIYPGRDPARENYSATGASLLERSPPFPASGAPACVAWRGWPPRTPWKAA